MSAESAVGWPALAPDFDLLGEAAGGELPYGCGAVLLKQRDDAELRPELVECAQDGVLGELAAEFGDKLSRGHRFAFGEGLVDLERERRDLDGAGGCGRLLPAFVAAQREDVAEDLRGDDEVRGVAGAAEEIERDGCAFGREARDERACGFGFGGGGCGR